MRMEAVEKGLRSAGAFGVLVTSIAVYSGFLRGLRHPKGRSIGTAPARLMQSGRTAVPLTIVGLGITCALWRPVRLALSGPSRAVATMIGALLYFPGLALMLWGRMTMGEMHNVSTSFGVQLYADQQLITKGPFVWVRHPMYVGGMMAELGALLLYRTWTTLLITANIPVLVVRARREEEALAAEFGEQWEQYRSSVPAWIPRLRG